MNYLSRPTQIQQPVERGDINFDLSILNTLQSKYDANKAIVDATLAQYEGLRGLNDTDNKYIAAQVSNIKNKIDSLGSLNLAHNTGRDTILNNMKSVLADPIVQDILVSKANKDRYDSEYQEMVKKDPSKGSDQNYAYGLYKGGYNEYMLGKSKKVGSMSYTAKGEPQKELKDIADNIEKYDTDIEKTFTGEGDKAGYIYTQKGKRITEDHLRKIAESFLSDGAKKQLVIDGWGAVHQGNTEEERAASTDKAFIQYKEQKLKNAQETLDLYTAQAKKTGSEEDKKYKKLAEENYANLEKSLSDVLANGSSEQKYGTLYRDTTITNFAKTFAYNTVDITDIKGDTVHMWKVDTEYKMQNDERDYQLKLKELNLKLDKDGNPVGDGSAFQTKADFDQKPGEEGNVQKQAMDEIDGLTNAIKIKEEVIFSNLDTKTQEGIDAEVKASKGKKTRADILMEYREGGLITNEDADVLNELIVDKYVKQEAYTKHAKIVEAEAEKKLDTSEMFKELFDRPNIKITWKGEDGKDHLYSAKDVLLANGMVNEKGEKIKSNPQVMQAIKKSMLADKILSNRFSYGDALRFSDRGLAEGLTAALGEEFNTGVKTIKIANNGGTQYIINPDSKTGRFIAEQKRKGAYNRAGVFSADDSFDDMSTLKEYFREIDPEEKNKKIGLRLMKDKTATFAKTVTVMPGTAEYEQIAQQAEFNVKGNVPIIIKKVPNQPEMVAISLGTGDATKNEPTETAVIAELRIRDLHPNVLSQIDLYNRKSKLTTENFPPMLQKATYTSKTGVMVTAVAKQFYGSQSNEAYDRANMTTIAGATEIYFKNFENLLGTEETPTKLGAAVKNMINSPDNYIETQKTKEGNDTYILPVLKKGETVLHVPKAIGDNLINDDNADSAQRNIKFIPQDYFNNYLLALLQSQNKNETDKFIKIYGQ